MLTAFVGILVFNQVGLKLCPDFNMEVSLDIVCIDVEHLNARPDHFSELW
jgi:hypothetical protein